MLIRRLLPIVTCLFSLGSYAQYYPAVERVSPEQLPHLQKQLHSGSTTGQRIVTLNALADLYLNLPLKKVRDLRIAEQYSQEALSESVITGNLSCKADALLILGQLYFINNTPDSIAQLMLQASDTTRAQLLLQLAFYYWYRDTDNKPRDFSKSIGYATQALAVSEKLSLGDLELMAKRDIAMANAMLKKPDGERGLLSMLQQYKQAGYQRLHYMYFPIAWYYFLTDRLDKAYYYSQLAVTAVNETRDTLAAGDMYLVKENIDYHRESYEDVIRSGETAIKFYSFQSGMYYVSSPDAYELITAAYDKLGKKKEAINYIVGMMKRYPPRSAEDSLKFIQQIGHAYREMKQFREAEVYFQRFLAISNRFHLQEFDARSSLGQLYLDAGQYEKARHYLYAALPMASALLSESGSRQFHYMIYLADSASGHYLAAIQQLNITNEKAFAAGRLERDKEVKKMEVAFRTEEMEHDLNLKNQNIELLQKEGMAQKERLKQSEKIGRLTAGGFALALIIIMLGIFVYRQKQQASQKMAQKNSQLQKLVSEKEWLLKEVHHRVKNNLHTVCCLLDSQARTASAEVRTALEKSQHRIYAMSLFHQKAYQSDDIGIVDFSTYIRDFLLFLKDGFDLETRNVRIMHDVEPIALPLGLAMTLALIANEALTNAAKYAFEGKDGGEINLTLTQQEQGILMTISDNGIGMRDPSSGSTLGLQLLHGLCADIGAKIQFHIKNGTRIDIRLDTGSNHGWQREVI